jgi:putative glutathione S-transferase
MGILIEGKWQDKWYDTASTDGAFKRQDSQFRNWITPDGHPGPTGTGGFDAEKDRYHLYVSLACPWAHRTLILRQLKGLEDLVSVSVVDPLMLENGWEFSDSDPTRMDDLYGAKYLYEIYLKASTDYMGRVTVPVLWDKKREVIVSNESAEIIRMFNSAFNQLTGNSRDYYPAGLRNEIDKWNDTIYATVNNGVYRAGFATSQTAYEHAYRELFDTLDHIDLTLAKRRYLTGDQITEADWRLFTTLVRFDAVYFGHFKCNYARISDYPNLSGYVCDLFQQDGVADTVDLPYIKQHYYGSHRTINPTGVIPLGQEPDFSAPHQRESLSITGKAHGGSQ